MGPPRTGAPRRASLLLLASAWSSFVQAIAVDVCATVNTATTARNISIYQSNGLCHDMCVSQFAFAVTQSSGCWCSDYFPDKASQVDPSKCNYPCPGYPPEACGGLSNGVEYYGYVQLNLVMPSGTASSPSSSASSTSSTSTTSSSSSSETVQVTATVSSSIATSTTSAAHTTSSTTEMPTTSTSSTSHEQSSSSSSSTSSSTFQTITDSTGAVRTVTVVPSVPADAGAAHVRASGFSSGAIAGVVIGSIIAVMIAAGGIFFMWRRYRRNRDDYEDDPSIRGSSSAMMGSNHPDMSNTTGDSMHSPASVGNRNSTIQIDPRMDPFKQGLYLRTNSHESLNTIRDDHDYSRRIQPPKVLRATNPDPDDI